MPSHESSRKFVPLTEYAENVVLPPSRHCPAAPAMPAPGEKSAMTTVADSKISVDRRNLSFMRPLSRSVLNVQILQYYQILSLNKTMHQLAIDDRAIPGHSELLFRGDKDVTTSAEDEALGKAVSILKSIDAQTENYYVDISMDRDGTIVPLKVIRDEQESQSRTESVRFGVFILGPWSFAPADFEEFVSIKDVSFMDSKGPASESRTEVKFTSAELMLAHVYNFCHENGCRFWAISTYEQWVFGAFLEDYSIGWTSPVYGIEAKGPNIVQCLEYWIHSAFDGINTWKPPIDEPSLGAMKTGASTKRQLSIGLGGDNGTEKLPSSKRGKMTPTSNPCGYQSDATWDEVAGERDGHNGAEPVLVKQAVRQILAILKESGGGVSSGNRSRSTSGTNYIFTNCVFNGHSLDGSCNESMPNIDRQVRPDTRFDEGVLPSNGYDYAIPTDPFPRNPFWDNEANPCNGNQILPPDGVAAAPLGPVIAICPGWTNIRFI
ncbi:hypothetical protein BD410DRAFT_361804 [Rickenella mellea]|uniref:Uncharacterized protein n=1 Tax=Rickenella mellea TaxID=50990 RepID=A0A4Y7PZ04_9AGAM|nr:hypothetical protein BD410DRAFT_361804 [Rickenella mellea]